ncbi:MAG TPA: discoidin domain-containing protein [Polyangiaceae bacterium]|nr:discoidin domain-containing protein [Polyangiaceae bacterium]
MLWFALAVVALGCSVYDESLRQGSSVAPSAGAADGGSNSASAGSEAGGSGGNSTAGAGTAAGGGLGDAGAQSAGGDSGEAGDSNVGGAGAPKGGAGGAVGSAGSAGRASGGSGGASAGSAGAGNAGSGHSGTGNAGAGNAGASNAGASNAGASNAGAGNAGAGAIVELGVAKPTTASSQQSANPSSSGNDGQTGTRWSANAAALPQWWRVDLGETHRLTKVSVRFEFSDRKYTYAVETSLDDVSYTAQANVVDGVGSIQPVPIPGNVSARYVRITCTNTVPGVDPSTGAARPTWASFWEVSVLGT